ncbi:sugar nucleotide-binding protein [Candidatus Pelagibacter sp.]|nr:sugar nucleotide-binding protein [Candidatus Pelagibacter sp.]
MVKKIIVTGGTGRFGNVLKKVKNNYNIFFPKKNELNILDYKNLKSYINKIKPKIIIHLAGLSRPMKIHEKEISKSIDLNIIGTCNITKLCFEKNIKLIYFSTNYVYPGTKGNYSEKDGLLPVNNYAWSKLGGEAAVHLYKNSLILRVCMTEKPFVHRAAFANVKNNFIYQEQVAEVLFKLLDQKGIINVGGKSQYIYDFVKKDKKDVKKIYLKRNLNIGVPFDSSMNIMKLKKIKKNYDKSKRKKL